MKYTIALFCMISNICFSQTYKQFTNKEIVVIYGFDKIDSQIFECNSFSAYMDSQICAVSDWGCFKYDNDTIEMSQSCYPFYNFYINNVPNQKKIGFSIDCDCFKHTLDSHARVKYPFYNVYKSKIEYMYRINKKIYSSYYLQNIGYNPVFVAFKVIGSGLIVSDSNQICMYAMSPRIGYHKYDTHNMELLPSILFSNIKSCSQLTLDDMNNFGFVRMKMNKIEFFYSDY